ncbi:MAG: hypothetical protein ACRC35_07845, partial [Angustibacter sp.]
MHFVDRDASVLGFAHDEGDFWLRFEEWCPSGDKPVVSASTTANTAAPSSRLPARAGAAALARPGTRSSSPITPVLRAFARFGVVRRPSPISTAATGRPVKTSRQPEARRP